MLRLFGTATVLLALILGGHADDKPDSKVQEFAKDLVRLNGSWTSPKIVLGPGVTGQFELKLEFKKDSTAGQATMLGAVSKSGTIVKVDPRWTVELKEKGKKRYIVLVEAKEAKREVMAEIEYEFDKDKLKLTCPKTLQFAKGTNPVEISGEWERKKADKK